MDLICPFTQCSLKLSDVNSYCKHVNRHVPLSEQEKYLQFSCPLCEQMSRISFDSAGLLKKHIKQVHPQFSAPSSSQTNNPPSKIMNLSKSNVMSNYTTYQELNSVDHFIEELPEELEENEITDPLNFLPKCSLNHFDARDEVFRLYSTLFAKPNIANKTVENIIKVFTKFFTESLDFIGENIKECPGSKNTFHVFQKSAFEITNALNSFNTKQKLVTGLKRSDVYADPDYFLLREHTVERLGELEEAESHGVIMPIKHQVKNFLQMPKVYENIIEHQNRTVVEGRYENLIDGSLWKKILNKFEGKNVIPIFLYNDDFQPDSALSPHNKSTKLGAYYYSFPTLPDYLATNLQNIFIAALVKVSEIDQNDIVTQEFDPPLFALYEILSDLEENGIDISVDGKIETVYIALPQFLGDNLGLNGCLGFPRGFTAKFICRICWLPKELREKATREVQEYLRNKDHFEICLLGPKSSIDDRKGVKFNCVLNYLKSFKVYENFSVDVMHDVHLGVFKTDISCVLDYYVNQRRTFTLDDFNGSKRYFDYGKKNQGNKTSDVLEAHITTSNKNESLRINAKEVWTLVEFLPLILKPLVTNYKSCTVFDFTVKMGEVLDSITKSSFTESDIVLMEERISEHHEMFLRLFGTDDSPQHFTPKFHNMLHYGTCVRLAGPLKKTMVFRFEQKHQELKQYAQACFSRVNLPLSLCRKFSLQSANHFLDRRNMFNLIKDVVFEDKTTVLGSYISEVSKPIKSLKFKAVLYELGDIIFHENEAFIIREIVKDCNMEEIYLYSKKLIYEYNVDVGFLEILLESDIFKIINISSLCHAPMNSHVVSNVSYFKIKSF